MLFEAFFGEDFCIVTDDIRLPLTVDFTCRSIGVFDSIGRKPDTLAEEMGQDVVGTDKLEAPVKRVEDVSFLIDKLIVRKGRFDVFKQLCNSGVGLLVILG